MPDAIPPYLRAVLSFAPAGNGAHAAIAAETAKAAPHAPAAAPVAADAEPIDAKLCARLALLVSKIGGVAAAARASGAGEHALRVWIAGLYAPPLLEMARLAEAAGMSLHWLATGVIAGGNGAGDDAGLGRIGDAARDAVSQHLANRKNQPRDATVVTVSHGTVTVTISGAARVVIGGQP